MERRRGSGAASLSDGWMMVDDRTTHIRKYAKILTDGKENKNTQKYSPNTPFGAPLHEDNKKMHESYFI